LILFEIFDVSFQATVTGKIDRNFYVVNKNITNPFLNPVIAFFMLTKVKVLKKDLKFYYNIARTLRNLCKFIQINLCFKQCW